MDIPILAFLFPLAVFLGTIFFTKHNITTGKFDDPINWKYVGIFTGAALGAVLLMGLL